MDPDKKELRRKVKQLISESATMELHSRSLEISRNLISLIHSLNDSKSLIGVFSPLSDEPNWELGFGEILWDSLAYPSIENGEMVYFKCKPDECVEQNDFGVTIKGPPDSVRNNPVVPDILVIPALAYDLKGRRLGRGKGYYDRYLENFNGRRVGICFDFQLLDHVPAKEHDQSVEYIVTDKKTINKRE